jgi:GntR family transcriptional regulator of abcA and norABC
MIYYVRIADKLRERIRAGELHIGAKLSQRAVATEYHVSKKTVSDAFEILESEGLILSKPRSGTIVSNNAWMLLAQGSALDWREFIESGMQIPSKADIYQIYTDLSSGRNIHLSGPRIDHEFGYHEAINAAMPYVAERLKKTNDLNHIDIRGLYSLRQTIAARLALIGVNTRPEEIMITTGMTESLAIISWAFLRAGITFIHDKPSVLNSMKMLEASGANIIRVPVDEEGPELQMLIKSAHKAAHPILYINPVNHYPTGVTISKTRRDQIMTACAKMGVPIIENDMHREFRLGKNPPQTN